VPLYESHPDVVKSELATFFDVFPDGSVWSNDISGKGYDVVLAGHSAAKQINIDSLQARVARPENVLVAQSLSEVGFNSAVSLLSTYAGQARDLAPWLVDAEINRDSNLRLQYLAGLGLNSYENAAILDEMLRYRKFPDNLIVGSDAEKDAVRQAIDNHLATP